MNRFQMCGSQQPCGLKTLGGMCTALGDVNDSYAEKCKYRTDRRTVIAEYDDGRLDKVFRLYNQHVGVAKICEIMEMDEKTVKLIINDTKRSPLHITAGERRKIIEMYLDGENQSAIAREMKRDKCTVHSILVEAGVELRRI